MVDHCLGLRQNVILYVQRCPFKAKGSWSKTLYSRDTCMKWREKPDTTWNIPRSITFSPLHFILYGEKWITFGTVHGGKYNCTFLPLKQSDTELYPLSVCTYLYSQIYVSAVNCRNDWENGHFTVELWSKRSFSCFCENLCTQFIFSLAKI